MSQLIADTFDEDEDNDDDDDDMEIKTIPLPNVSSKVLKIVIEYGKHYQEEQMTPIQSPLKSGHLKDLVQEWYVDFVNVDQKTLFDLVAAANFMDVKPLLDLACLAVSILIKGKSKEELREMFKVSAESAAEEDEQVREENSWVQLPPSSENQS